MTGDERDDLAHEICAAIGKALDEAGVFVRLAVPLPGTNVVFLRGLGLAKGAEQEE